MVILLTIIHVLVCLFLIIVVLLQSGKAADLAGAFGGMGSQTAFGPRGSATILAKATRVAAAVFMLTSLTLAILATGRAPSAKTVLEDRPAPAPQSAPAPSGQAPAGQPSMTITPEGGPSQTIPLNIPPRPESAPAAPAQQQTPAPAQK
ncbi:MAG TPA: preprotein translocase subunit SecG [Bryobacteraceae bacterium]|nr:preprotein translocase subunit SecG [Bryobacteraceae bacterium]HOL71506.1 preprotein translocase subunit SecG [Bryobacteraceae bacterium]HOQ45302.1 preprotein translocase subunit SecG [Bryobacteraceae bacterium]HPQ13633.1 preprotein translocase subunit SecG [Bryobacteraceae bacterium]HPU71386.1 preprotein translocase subunit SecG [Bryobacteraceae bacterium]